MRVNFIFFFSCYGDHRYLHVRPHSFPTRRYSELLRLLDLLERYDAKAVLFISPANVIEQKRFWPDALGIGAKRTALAPREEARRRNRVTLMPHTESAPLLHDMFGADIFRPQGDLDRPPTVRELKTLEIGRASCRESVCQYV